MISNLYKVAKRRPDNSLCNDYWLGLSDPRGEGDYVLASSGQNPSYANWGQNEPNNFGSERCAMIKNHDEGNTATWNNLDCDLTEHWWCKLSALCEKIVN